MFFGDSSLDMGNLDDLLDGLGVSPFPEPLYNGDSASDELVLSEWITVELELERGASLRRGSTNKPVHPGFSNYAYATATSGQYGSISSGAGDLSIGLATQVEVFLGDINRLAKGGDFEAPDAFFSIGSNDVFDLFGSYLASSGQIQPAELFSQAQAIGEQVVASVERLQQQGAVEDTVLLGLSRLSQLPFLQGLLQNLFPDDLQQRTLLEGVVDTITGIINGVMAAYAQTEDSVYFVNAYDDPADPGDLYSTAVANWEAALDKRGLDAFAGSFQFYAGADPVIPDQFRTLDGNHPTSFFSQFLAAVIVEDIEANAGFVFG